MIFNKSEISSLVKKLKIKIFDDFMLSLKKEPSITSQYKMFSFKVQQKYFIVMCTYGTTIIILCFFFVNLTNHFPICSHVIELQKILLFVAVQLNVTTSHRCCINKHLFPCSIFKFRLWCCWFEEDLSTSVTWFYYWLLQEMYFAVLPFRCVPGPGMN